MSKDFFDAKIESSFIDRVVSLYKDTGIEVNQEWFSGENTCDFYKGMVAASQVFVTLLEQSGAPSDVVKIVQKIGSDAAFLSKQKESLIIIG